MQKMIPHLWFDQTAEEAVQFYVHLFPRASIKGLTHYGKKGLEIHGHATGRCGYRAAQC